MAKQIISIGYNKESGKYSLRPEGEESKDGLTQSQLEKKLRDYRSNSRVDFGPGIPQNVQRSLYDTLTGHR